jgi:hypothetical protein
MRRVARTGRLLPVRWTINCTRWLCSLAARGQGKPWPRRTPQRPAERADESASDHFPGIEGIEIQQNRRECMSFDQETSIHRAWPQSMTAGTGRLATGDGRSPCLASRAGKRSRNGGNWLRLCDVARAEGAFRPALERSRRTGRGALATVVVTLAGIADRNLPGAVVLSFVLSFFYSEPRWIFLPAWTA